MCCVCKFCHFLHRYEKQVAMMADAVVNASGNMMQTPKGLVFINDWGPLRHAAGSAGVLAHFARTLKGKPSSNGIDAAQIINFAEKQVRCGLRHAAAPVRHVIRDVYAYTCTQPNPWPFSGPLCLSHTPPNKLRSDIKWCCLYHAPP